MLVPAQAFDDGAFVLAEDEDRRARRGPLLLRLP